jgi:hypothetical protein
LADLPAVHPGRLATAGLWRTTLAQIPTHFGRLVFLASLRDPATGKYGYPQLNQVARDEDADRTLRHRHQELFQQWLGFSLAEQKRDLKAFLGSGPLPRNTVSYREIIPLPARDIERQLYLTDLETLLELLGHEHDVASSATGA